MPNTITRSRTITSVSSWISTALAIVIGLLLPIGYFSIQYAHQQSTVRAESSLSAAFLAQLFARHPELTELRSTGVDLIELVEVRIDDDAKPTYATYERRAILSTKGREVVSSGGAARTAWPRVQHLAPVRYADKVVCYFEVQRSLRPLLQRTGAIALASGLLAALLWLAIKLVPLRALQRAEQRLSFLAHYDSLTGLPNRNLLRSKLRKAVQQAEKDGSRVAVLYVDLDRLKTVNDTLGHAIGDHVIHAAAQRIRHAVRGSDTVARLSGDEFVLLLENVRNPDGVAIVARNVLAKFEQPFSISGQEIYVTASAGAAFYPSDGKSVEELLKNADAAMYAAKVQRDGFQFYRSEMTSRAQDEMRIEGALRRALDSREFLLHYQPILTPDGTVIGAEALLRWQRPDHGLVPPLQFINLLESRGLIVPVGAWVLHEACAQVKRWRDAGSAELMISVNVSARQFRDKTLVDTVRSALAQSELPARLLQLEITETLLMSDHELNLAKLRELAALGVRIAVDDFGTGYSSLAYLRRFPVNGLKVDRSFVNEVVSNEDHAAIVTAVIQLAHTLRLSVTAEGVETEDQCAFLRERQCNLVQGFLFSKPLPPVDFERYLHARAAAALSATPRVAVS